MKRAWQRDVMRDEEREQIATDARLQCRTEFMRFVFCQSSMLLRVDMTTITGSATAMSRWGVYVALVVKPLVATVTPDVVMPVMGQLPLRGCA